MSQGACPAVPPERGIFAAAPRKGSPGQTMRAAVRSDRTGLLALARRHISQCAGPTILVGLFGAYNMYAALGGTSPAFLTATQRRSQDNSQYNQQYMLSHTFCSPFSVSTVRRPFRESPQDICYGTLQRAMSKDKNRQLLFDYRISDLPKLYNTECPPMRRSGPAILTDRNTPGGVTDNFGRCLNSSVDRRHAKYDIRKKAQK